MHNLTNEAFTQYFVDATYHCIPPTIRRYKLFIISGFNLKEKKTYICCVALIPNKKYEAYEFLLSILKNKTFNYRFL